MPPPERGRIPGRLSRGRISGVAAALALAILVVALRAGAASDGAAVGTGVMAEAVASTPEAVEQAQAASGAELIAGLRCGACHLDLPQPRDRPSLRRTDARSIFDALLSDAHPDLHLSDDEALALALGVGAGDARERGLARMQRQHPRATRELGRRTAAALNCGGCHEGLPTQGAAAPLLVGLMDGTRDDWLREYLRAPRMLRPFGARPGGGSRMPDFRLSAAQADSIAAFLRRGAARDLPPAAPSSVSVHAAETADALLDRLSCRGCHSYRGRGGRMGPALDDVHTRRTPAYITDIIRDPARTRPGAPMPRIEHAHVDRVIALLVGGDPRAGAASPTPATYLSPLDHPLIDGGSADETQLRYALWCAACHGVDGGGRGYNAPYLAAPPAAHTDAGAMSLRPDDTLYDGIAAGGAALGRSPEMPPFAGVIDALEVRALVARIRALCRCSGPAWSEPHAR
jgi:mono/diheme cytochrome c family protein